jgi:hypothetical protein
VTAAPGRASEESRDLPAWAPVRRPASLGIPVIAFASAPVPPSVPSLRSGKRSLSIRDLCSTPDGSLSQVRAHELVHLDFAIAVD